MDQSENIIREKEKQSDLVCKMSCHGKKKRDSLSILRFHIYGHNRITSHY